MANRPCETCPFKNVPLSDIELWQEVAEAQRRVTPELTDETNAHLTQVEMQMRAGMETHMDECPGYSLWRAIGNKMIDGIAGSGRLVQTDKGTRVVPWAEITCNNPFLQTEEYKELASQFIRQVADDYDQNIRAQAQI